MHLHQYMPTDLLASEDPLKAAMFLFQTALANKMADDTSYHVDNKHCTPLHLPRIPV